MANAESAKFLPAMVKAMRAAHAQGADLSTQSFTELMEQVVLIFDYLGTVLHFAKHDMETKIQSLHAAAPNLPQLRQVVEADIAARRATVKDSCARNTHRLLCVLAFMRVLLEHLAKGPQVSLRDAASAAYEQALAPIHGYVVRTAVWAGLGFLPSREHFMQSIGETEETARDQALDFLERCKDVELTVNSMYNGVTIPASAPTSNILAGIWGGKAKAHA